MPENPDDTLTAVRPPRRTAHDAAREHVAAGRHVHLVSDAMPHCLSGHCTGLPDLLRGTV